MEVVGFIAWFLKTSWLFFTQTTVPGMNFTFAALFVGLFLAVLSLRLLSYMFGFGGINSNSILGLQNAFKKDSDKK